MSSPNFFSKSTTILLISPGRLGWAYATMYTRPAAAAPIAVGPPMTEAWEGEKGEEGGVVGVEGDMVQAGIVGRLDQQRQVRAPVAGDHGVGAGLLDLRDIG